MTSPRLRLPTWLLALLLASLLLARPLHEAEHLVQPVQSGPAQGATSGLATVGVAALSGGLLDGLSDALDASDIPNVPNVLGATDAPDVHEAGGCSWCLLLAQAHALLDWGHRPTLAQAPPLLPPVSFTDTQPQGHSPLAAQPRGPPARG